MGFWRKHLDLVGLIERGSGHVLECGSRQSDQRYQSDEAREFRDEGRDRLQVELGAGRAVALTYISRCNLYLGFREIAPPAAGLAAQPKDLCHGSKVIEENCARNRFDRGHR